MSTVARVFAGPVMVVAGILHFVKPKWYLAIMPPYVPRQKEMVYVSGVFEGGSALLTMHPKTRRPAGLVLIATLLAIFPANVHMALHPEQYKVPGGPVALYARLPLQALFVFWAWLATQRD